MDEHHRGKSKYYSLVLVATLPTTRLALPMAKLQNDLPALSLHLSPHQYLCDILRRVNFDLTECVTKTCLKAKRSLRQHPLLSSNMQVRMDVLQCCSNVCQCH